ncbi:MAG: YXWGXW repeat-containing protein, partial [Kofleriaceae bacterium]|nr:YXWGXW repeat-containing protein [Kofleriaceae bacterium]
MAISKLKLALGALLVVAATGCTVRGQGPVMRTSGHIAVGTPRTYTVSSLPPQPLYEQRTASPGYGNVWIEGAWSWNGYEWAWKAGHWERERSGYVYVAPYYDYSNNSYVFVAGYWEHQSRIPRGYRADNRRT